MRHWAEFSIEQADDAFVTGKQIGYVLRGQVVHGEQVTRHVNHFTQDTVARHMYAVVVARRQIGGGEAAVTEQVSHDVVTREQRFERVIMAFGLQNFVVFNRAKLANYAVGRHHQHAWVGVDRAGIFTQRTDEEVVESTVAGGVRLLRFFHIDLVELHEQIDNQFRQPSRSFARTPACETRKPQFRQNVLQ